MPKGDVALGQRLSFRGRHLLLLDVLATSVAFLGSFALRFDPPSAIFDEYLRTYVWLLPLLIVVRTSAFVWLRLYQRVWRYASVEELVAVVLAVLSSSVVVYSVAFALVATGVAPRAQGFPRSIPVIDTLLALTLSGSWRFALLLLHAGRSPGRNAQPLKRAVVVGGGSAAIGVLRELRANSSLGFVPVGLVADDHQKGQRLMGVPVLDGLARLSDVIRRERVAVVLFALPSADGRTLRQLVAAAELSGARCLTVPSIAEVVSGKVTMSAFREIDVEDLLRRAPARIDLETVSAHFAGRRILVTGAGGSIGGELVRQLLRFEPSDIVLVGRGENSIFETMQSIAERPPTTRLHPAILDVRDGVQLDALLELRRPEVVFHAAAHKHVTFMEQHPAAAVDTNVLGTWRLLQSCLRHGVQRFVLISSDKAVRPKSVMGATKRVSELLVLWAAGLSGKQYSIVRFGNVLSSRGSVVPLFRREIERGGPITISHPEVSRYFMTIPEAVQLVLQAAVFAEGGEVFVLDMGEPVLILELARHLATLHGLELGRDIAVEFTGLAPGEKLTEELFFPQERPLATDHEAIRRVRSDPDFTPEEMERTMAELSELVAKGAREQILRGLNRLVPEYEPVDPLPLEDSR